MTRNFFVVVSALTIGSTILTSCETPEGERAAYGAATGSVYGAATGALIGAAATGRGRGTAIGAAAGAAAGALTGALQAQQATRYGPPPPGGFPFARWTGTPGLYRSPYTGRVYNLRGVPPGGLVRDIDTGRLFRRP